MPRKGRFGYDAGNTTADGDYIVGKGRPPEHGKFKKGDGRKRGRRSKGTRNLATDLREEMDSTVTVTVGGVPKKVTRQQAIIMRLADNATKGQTAAIALALDINQRLVGPLLEREEERKRKQQPTDMSHLSFAELEAVEYLMAKLGMEEDSHSHLIGIIPVYKEGYYIGSHERAEIEWGLKTYGVNADQIPSHALKTDTDAPKPKT